MKVRTLKPHSNTLGEKHAKAVGDEYDAGSHADVLIADGIAEAVDAVEPPLDLGDRD
jgi:hypothetical protein